LLDKLALYLGPGVFISDDGSIQDKPLRAKIPEMLAALTLDRDTAMSMLEDAEARVARLTAALRIANGGIGTLDEMMKQREEHIGRLTAENKGLREALDTIESMATDSSLDIQGVAQDALKPPAPQEYDDSSSTIEEQKAFEEGCLERLDILTKQGGGGGPTDALIDLLIWVTEQRKEKV
jgi:chromosome segregation ATPase